MYSKVNIITLLLFLGSFSTYGQLSSVEDSVILGNTYQHPVAKQLHPLVGVGDVRFGYQNSSIPEELQFQSGNKISRVSFQTEQIIHEKNWTYWGNATYQYDKRYGKYGSILTEPWRLGPYQVTDTIGGNQTLETYNLKGGVSKTIQNLELGLEGGYNFSQSYRRTDPRPRNNTSDVMIALSSGYKIGNIMLGITGRYNVYKQKNQTRNYIPNRKDYIFLTQGIGNISESYTDNDGAFSIDYQGYFWSGALFFHTLGQKSSWRGNILVKVENIEQRINLNKQRPYQYTPHLYQLEVGHTYKKSAWEWQSMATASFHHNTGLERRYKEILLDKEAYITDYILITELEKYKEQYYDLQWQNIISYKKRKLHSWFKVNIGAYDHTIQNLSPNEYFKQQYIIPSLSLTQSLFIGRFKLGWNIGGERKLFIQKDNKIDSKLHKVPHYAEGLQHKLETAYSKYHLRMTWSYSLPKNKQVYINTNGFVWQTKKNYYSAQIILGLKL
ncbi:hypothetical protein K5X82_00530 [Halosquirtibacter xylanolyticus]|uniref:DUF6850 family outer membrane beta-barrel protein n=1 Tax=Halosquirtibacter xylanolyticus TaxID=3374599 RepID=UPI003748742E|nr:hypothetical protein K5X82_00530 [Prolixibacteraceae bacterium]